MSTAIALGLNIKLSNIKVSNILAPGSLHCSLVDGGNGEPNHVVSDPVGALSKCFSLRRFLRSISLAISVCADDIFLTSVQCMDSYHCGPSRDGPCNPDQ